MKKAFSLNLWIIIKLICLILIYANDMLEQGQAVKYLRYGYYYQYTFLFIFLLINDYYRYKYLIKKENLFAVSLILSILVSVAAYSFLDSSIYPYYILLLYDILVSAQYMSKAMRYSVLTFHILIFTALIISLFLNDRSTYGYLFSFFYSIRHFSMNSVLNIFSPRGQNLELFLWNYSPYIFSYLFLYLIFFQIAQRNRYKVLYEENELANRKLEDYAKRIEKLAVTEERNRIAQDVHDSVGHSLIALIMHLNFLEKKCGNNTRELIQIVDKCQDFAKDSLENMRKAVYAMREAESINSFAESLNGLIGNFKDIEGTTLKISVTGEIESLPPDTKDVLLKTIRESITNSIRHGNPGTIDITLERTEDSIHLYVVDNGMGTDNIVPGNGLNGIEKRIAAIGGRIHFSSKPGLGFKTFVAADLNAR